MFPQSMVLVQKAEYDWPSPFARPLQDRASAVTKLEGDHDVFGDGSVTLIWINHDKAQRDSLKITPGFHD
jgi:N-acyl homoserine lactone hydrolase